MVKGWFIDQNLEVKREGCVGTSLTQSNVRLVTDHGGGRRETNENQDRDFGGFSAYAVELFENDGEVEKEALILQEKRSSDLEDAVPLGGGLRERA